MTTAFVLLNMDLGYNKSMIETLKSLPEVHYVYPLYGVYDVIVKVECDSIEAMKDFIANKIRINPEIKTVLTNLVVDDFTDAR